MNTTPSRDEQPADVEQKLRSHRQQRSELGDDTEPESPDGSRLRQFDGAFETQLALSLRDRTHVPVEVTTWHWGKPYDEDYLAVTLPEGVEPEVYDFVAFYDGEPTDPYDWVGDHYYWMEDAAARPTLVPSTTDEVTHVGYVGFSDGRFRILNAEPVETSDRTRDVSDGQGVATVPHPDVEPAVIVEADSVDGSVVSETNADHDVWAVSNVDERSPSEMLVWSNPTKADKWAWVAIYLEDPREAGTDSYTTWAYVYDWFGNVRRSYSTVYGFTMNQEWYWAGFVDGDGDLLAVSEPMRSHPDWMSSMKADIRDRKLRELCIPGTHDSGTYDPVSPFGAPWVQTQDQSISQQLEDGIRFLDVRIGYYPDTEEKYSEAFWLVHGDWSTWVELEEFLDEVGSFLHDHDEILLLNFHRFNRFDEGEKTPEEVHEMLVERIMNADLPGGGTLSDVLAPDSYGNDVTPGTLWENDENAIVLYGRQNATSRRIARSHDLLWLEPHGSDIGWPNTDSPEEMIEYCEEQVENDYHNDFWFLGSMLTPHSISGVRALARSGNPYITNKLATGWAEKVNVVPVDFYRSTPVVELAIEANRR